jgi:predicted small integral membrane protein
LYDRFERRQSEEWLRKNQLSESKMAAIGVGLLGVIILFVVLDEYFGVWPHALWAGIAAALVMSPLVLISHRLRD